MKKEEVIKKVLKYLAQQGSSTSQDIAKNIGVPFIQLGAVTKLLVSENLISYNAENKTYSLLESKTGETEPETPVAENNLKEKAAKNVGAVIASKGKRDFSKFKFQGKEYNKSRLVMAVLAKYAEDHNPSLSELKTAFPDEEIKPYGYGLFRLAAEAKKVNDEGRQRFFCKETELIKIKYGKIASTNQITSDLLIRFLTVAKKHKYIVK